MGSNYAVAKRPTRGKRLSAGGEPHREPGKWVFTSVNTTRVRTALKSNQSAERPAEWRQPSPADMDCRCSTCRSRGRTTLCSVQSKRFQAQSHADARSLLDFLIGHAWLTRLLFVTGKYPPMASIIVATIHFRFDPIDRHVLNTALRR